MILTKEKMMALNAIRAQAESAAQKQFESLILPRETKRLSTFFDKNVSKYLVESFTRECENAPSRGIFINPSLRICMYRSKSELTITLNLKDAEEENAKVHIVESAVVFNNTERIKKLIESAASSVNLRFKEGDLCTSDAMNGFLEIDFSILN